MNPVVLRVLAIPAVLAGLGFVAVLGAAEMPQDELGRLGADEFRVREEAEAALLAWARQDPERTIRRVFRESRDHADPEVRDRCLSVLKELANDEYLRDGEGYIGIWMQNETMLVPGDERMRQVVRVQRVMPGSAAELAGVKAQDLIVGAGEIVWYEGEASERFSEVIRQMKPRETVRLKVIRDGELREIKVILGRRPADADIAFQHGDPAMAEEAARRARERFFEAWLRRQAALDE